MCLFRNGYAAVLLLVLTQNSAGASFGNKALDEAVISLMQVPWIHRIESVQVRSLGDSCAEEIEAMQEAINAEEIWAQQMVDASSKIQSGILKGNTRDLGMYDECVEANGQYNGTDVRGKHCMVSFIRMSSSACVPSSCNETDVVEIVNAVIQNVTGIAELELEITEVSCTPVDSEPFTVAEIMTIIFLSTVGAFIIFCTVCEFVKKCKPAAISPVINELIKFSLYTNAMTLLSTKVSPGVMPAIQGIRFLTMCWVVLGHHYVNLLSGSIINIADIPEWIRSWTALYIEVAPFGVDTFFVISGFLMVYLFLKSKQLGKSSNFTMMYLHRYLRLTPCLAVLMLFFTVLFHRVANGPIWNTGIAQQVDYCRQNWWVNLLYVQNFVRATNICLGHTWYLAVDMQLFWISPIILYPLHRWPKWGLGILCGFLVASVIVPTVILVVNEYSLALIRSGGPIENITDNFLYYYIPTYTRACAYFVGMLLGYDVANKRRTLTRWNVTINWIVSCIFMLICGLATKRVWDSTLGYSLALETTFAITLRPFWSMAIAWIVYACTQGYGGPVTRFLSLPIFLPLSRLSYSIYLVHMVIQLAKVSSTQTPFRFDDFLLFNEFWSDLVLSIVVAFFLSLFFESPVIVLEKILTNRGRRLESYTVTKDGIDNRGMTET